MDKRVRFQQDCQKLANRIYGVAYEDLDDSQAGGVARLAQGRVVFSWKTFLRKLFIGS